MDLITDSSALSLWLIHYGGIMLFALLAVGIVALPVPEETLMVLAGILMKSQHLIIWQTLLGAYAGSICGITISFLLGCTASKYLLQYGGYIGLTPAHINNAHTWFERFGKWTLFIGYFIPGIRHFTGFCAGMTKLSFQEFALFAYSGALVWVTTFLSVGFFFGTYWLKLYEQWQDHIEKSLIVAAVLVAIYCLYRFVLRKKNQTIQP